MNFNKQSCGGASCSCIDFNEIPVLRDGIFPDCLPDRDTIFIYAREDELLYYYDSFGNEHLLRGEGVVDIIDNLNSDDPEAALSANQGKILNEKIPVLSDKLGISDKLGVTQNTITKLVYPIYDSDASVLAIGLGSTSSGANSIAIGKNTKAEKGGIAIGAGSEIKESDVIGNESSPLSIGSSTIKRRIINLKDGEKDSDATTLKQVKELTNDARSNELYTKYYEDIIEQEGKYQVHKSKSLIYNKNISSNITLTDISEESVPDRAGITYISFYNESNKSINIILNSNTWNGSMSIGFDMSKPLILPSKNSILITIRYSGNLALISYIGDSGVPFQSDWEETDENSKAFIRNKPFIIEEAPKDGNYYVRKDGDWENVKNAQKSFNNSFSKTEFN